MGWYFAYNIYCGVHTHKGNKPSHVNKESETQTVLQASIPKVVSALGFPVLTVYVIGAEHNCCHLSKLNLAEAVI